MTDTGRPTLAYRATPGDGPPIVFLPGYASTMEGTKVRAVEAWARDRGRPFVRFDYAGCGQSTGDFAAQRFVDWLDDAKAVIAATCDRPAILVGSSMGGWLMLLIARDDPARVAGLVGVAAAPDFTDWGFTQAQKMAILRDGRVLEPSPYDSSTTVTTRAFWQSGEAHRVMHGPIAIDAPVRLLQGQADREVPWERAVALAALIRSADVQTWLVKDGDHRLSRASDIALLAAAIEDVAARS